MYFNTVNTFIYILNKLRPSPPLKSYPGTATELLICKRVFALIVSFKTHMDICMVHRHNQTLYVFSKHGPF